MWKFIRSLVGPNFDAMTSEEKVLYVLVHAGAEGVPLPKLLEVCPASYRMAITRLRKRGHCILCQDRYIRKNGTNVNHPVYFYL